MRARACANPALFCIKLNSNYNIIIRNSGSNTHNKNNSDIKLFAVPLHRGLWWVRPK